jgi:N-acetyl-anhydromuramyl-L-alanine amidase AmpD
MSYLSDSRVKYIVIHYSATAIEVEYPYGRLEADHLARGFREGGYHYYLPRKGGRIAGRDLSQAGRFEMGAHSKGENVESVGICFEGGLTRDDMQTGRDTRTAGQVDEMIRTILELKKRYPNAKVTGHRDMPGAATQCPGFDAGKWWDGVMASPELMGADEVRGVSLDRAKEQPKPAGVTIPTGKMQANPIAALFAALASFFAGKKP